MACVGARRVFRQPWGRRVVMRGSGLSFRGLSTPVAQRSPNRLLHFPTAKDGLHTHTCTSLEDILAIPPPSRRPWRRSAPGPAPEVTPRDKRAVGLLQPLQEYPLVLTPCRGKKIQ